MHVHLKAVRRPGPVERLIQRARRQYRMQAAAPRRRRRSRPLRRRRWPRTATAGLLAIEDEGNGGDGSMLAPWRARATALLAGCEAADGVPECADA